MPTLYTIGHSTHTLEEIIHILHEYKIVHVVDVRTVPKSRHVPWFNKQTFSKALQRHDIAYSHMPKLGGLRHASKDSINTGWRNASFRGYADYMQTPMFFAGLQDLNKLLIARNRIVIMCAEAPPWRCHRSLIADAEVIRKIKVLHIMNYKKAHPHELTAFAQVNRNKRPIQVTYPG